MSVQITVRLPDEDVVFMDALVAKGVAKSRAEVVGKAIERERRRLVALRDVAILTANPDDGYFDALAEIGATVPIPD